MTSNSGRSCWTTWRPRDRPLCSTSRPQEEGVLCSSSCLCSHRSRNHHALWRLLPLLPPPPTMAAKARVRAIGRGKVRTTALVAPGTTAGAPRCGPPSTIPRLAPSRCGQGCILCSSSRHVHCSTPCLMHQHTAVPPSCPC
jgi:hypothetical protein